MHSLQSWVQLSIFRYPTIADKTPNCLIKNLFEMDTLPH